MGGENLEKKVGRYENVYFPELNIGKLKGKIDTGAYGIALHVDDIEIVDGKLKFKIDSNEFIYDKFKKVSVKSSFGRKQERFLVFTKIKIGESTYKFFISLANRKNMRYPVLIGRRFLHKFNYIVDVRMKNINDTDKKK
jgi:hypothetical protein